MSQIRTSTLEKKSAIELIQILILISIATAAPLLQNQYLTGPLVNATLFISVALYGFSRAVWVGVFPSLIALSVGLLPSPLAPMIPFIMISNLLLMSLFQSFNKKNYWFGIISASISKGLFLIISSYVIINLITQDQLAKQVAIILSWPQIITALLGGVIAFGILKIVKKV